MPKAKAETVSLWICHTVECPWCMHRMLITEDPVKGDKIKCRHCDSPLKVGEICGDYRDDKKPRELDVESID